ncbi:MAG: aminotransferase class V-fold PLP-dependent enzyme [Oscillospiraceae bacterium]
MFESGTLGVCSIAGLEQGVRFVQRTGVENICRHETRLAQKLYDGLAAIPGVALCAGILHESVPVVCFNLEGMDSETVTQLLNRHQIAVRARPTARRLRTRF